MTMENRYPLQSGFVFVFLIALVAGLILVPLLVFSISAIVAIILIALGYYSRRKRERKLRELASTNVG